MDNHSINTTVPQLRFPDFLNDKGWEVKRLGDCLIQPPDYGLNSPAVPFSDNLPTYLRITDISDDGYFIKEGKTSVDTVLTNENSLQEGDIVFARTGASVGKVYKYRKEDGPLVFAGFLIRIKPDNTKLDSDFLFQFLFSNTYKRWVDVTSTRSGQPGINSADIASLQIPFPPLAEQRRIAQSLTSLDDLIAATNEKLEQMKAYKKGLIQKLFPAKGKKLPELRFKEFEKDGDWEEKELGMAAKVKSGYAFRSNTYTQTGKFRIITISNVKNGYLDMTSNNFVENLPEDIQAHQVLQKGDILISMTGNVGRVCKVCCDNCLLNQRVGLVDIYSSDVDRNFIYTILTSDRFEKSMIENGQGAAQANIGNKDIEGYCLFCPPTLLEQRKIADSFTSIDKMINQYTNKVALMELYKKGLMQQLFPDTK